LFHLKQLCSTVKVNSSRTVVSSAYILFSFQFRTWLAQPDLPIRESLPKRLKWPWTSAEIFPSGETSRFFWSFWGCCRCNANWRSQNTLLLLHHKENSPWKLALHSHLFWNLLEVEL